MHISDSISAQSRSNFALNVAATIAQIGTALWDRTEDRLNWSEPLEQLYGLLPGEFAGTTEAFLNLIHPDDRSAVETTLRQLPLQPTYEFECRPIRFQSRYLRHQGRLIADEQGQFTLAIEAVTDISDCRRAEIAYCHLRDRQTALLSYSQELIVELNAEQRMVWISPSIESLLGYEREVWYNQPLVELVHPDDHSALQQVFSIGDAVAIDLRVCHCTYGWTHLSLQFAPIESDHSRMMHAQIQIESHSNQRWLPMHAFLSALPGAFYSAQPKDYWQFRCFTEGFTALTGYAAEQIALVDLIAPADLARCTAEVIAALDDRNIFNVQYRLTTADRQTRWVNEIGLGRWNDSGDLVGIDGVIFDISAEMRVKAAFAASEQRFKLTFTQNSVAMNLTDLSGQYIQVNQAFCDLLGYKESELLKLRFQDLTHPSDWVNEESQFSALTQDWCSGYSLEKRYRRADGSWIWVQIHPVILTDEKGSGYLSTIVLDIHDRKLAEAAQAQSLAVLVATLESSADGLLVLDCKGEILHYNQQFVALWRLPGEALIERVDEVLLPYQQALLCNPDDFLAQVQAEYDAPELDHQGYLQLKDGRIFYRFSKPVRVSGQVVGRVVSYRNEVQRP